jgi:hypothetical protein
VAIAADDRMMLTTADAAREDSAQTGETADVTTHATARPVAAHMSEVAARDVHIA